LCSSLHTRTTTNRQDYLFVHTFTNVTARVRALFPESDTEVRNLLAEGYAALLEKRRVFTENAMIRNVPLPFTPNPEVDPDEESKKDSALEESEELLDPRCFEYACWMMACVEGEGKIADEANLLLFLWTIERCSYEAFLFVKQSDKYSRLPISIRNFVDWWSSDDFKNYVNALEKAFDKKWDKKWDMEEDWDESEAFNIVTDILEYEKDFWAASRD
jgi:thiaminase